MVTAFFSHAFFSPSKVDTARLDVNAQREALNRERAENEALFARQQTELVELHEV